jgi:hypothetical protein
MGVFHQDVESVLQSAADTPSRAPHPDEERGDEGGRHEHKAPLDDGSLWIESVAVEDGGTTEAGEEGSTQAEQDIPAIRTSTAAVKMRQQHADDEGYLDPFSQGDDKALQGG